MGVQGLLKAIEDVQSRRHVSELSGKRVGIDAFAWLHRASCCCAAEIAQSIATDRHIKSCVRRLRVLLEAGVTPVLVFDGDELPAKRETNSSRSTSRRSAKAKGLDLLRDGRVKEAHKFFVQCVSISHDMAHDLLEASRKIGVESIVAPYEADAQLAFFSTTGYIDGVFSEDSDLLVYGCLRVFYKLDNDGFFREVSADSLFKSSLFQGIRDMNKEIFTLGSVLAGCDYAKSVGGVGIKKAFRYVGRWGADINKIIRAMKFDGLSVPVGYEEDVLRALITFEFPIVFNPTHDKLQYMNSEDGEAVAEMATALNGECGVDKKAFLGNIGMPRDCAIGLCRGLLHPFTKKPYASQKVTPHTVVAPLTIEKPPTAVARAENHRPRAQSAFPTLLAGMANTNLPPVVKRSGSSATLLSYFRRSGIAETMTTPSSQRPVTPSLSSSNVATGRSWLGMRGKKSIESFSASLCETSGTIPPYSEACGDENQSPDTDVEYLTSFTFEPGSYSYVTPCKADVNNYSKQTLSAKEWLDSLHNKHKIDATPDAFKNVVKLKGHTQSEDNRVNPVNNANNASYRRRATICGTSATADMSAAAPVDVFKQFRCNEVTPQCNSASTRRRLLSLQGLKSDLFSNNHSSAVERSRSTDFYCAEEGNVESGTNKGKSPGQDKENRSDLQGIDREDDDGHLYRSSITRRDSRRRGLSGISQPPSAMKKGNMKRRKFDEKENVRSRCMNKQVVAAAGLKDSAAAGLKDSGASCLKDSGAAGVKDSGAAGVKDSGAAGVKDSGAAGVKDSAAVAAGGLKDRVVAAVEDDDKRSSNKDGRLECVVKTDKLLSSLNAFAFRVAA